MSTLALSPVQRDGDKLFTTSEAIAQGAGVEHRATLQLIERHLADLEEFGRVAFQMRPFETAGGTQSRRIARLNEPQSTLLLTYLRNTEQVRTFKKALVKAFYEMARQLNEAPALPQDYASALRELAATVEARDLAEKKARELEPAASAWNVMVEATGDYSVDEAAKILCRDPRIKTGRQRLFSVMADLGWIYRQGLRRRWHAYQTAVETGRVVEKATASFLNSRTGEMENPGPTIRITAKGLEYLHRHFTGEQREVAA